MKKTIISSGDAYRLRQKLGLTQADFWAALGVSQSTGCRYEAGRKLPRPVQRLYMLTYGTQGLLQLLSIKEKKAYNAL
jgi:DNA-binding transcriptional regulator YiaG